MTHPNRAFHLGWMLGLVPLAAIVFDLTIDDDVVPAIFPWLGVFPLVGILATVIWRDGRSRGVFLLGLAPSVLSLLVFLTLLGFAAG